MQVASKSKQVFYNCSVAAWLLMVLALLLIGLMLFAGFWQWERADQANEIKNRYAHAVKQPALEHTDLDTGISDLQYRKVRLHGQYVSQQQFLLDNQIFSDVANKYIGYVVLSPFQLSDGRVVMVNRGWVALEDNRDNLPNLSVSTEPREIRGQFYLPSRSFRLGDMDAGMAWPRVIQYIDFDTIARRLNKAVLPAMVILDAEQADAYRYNWKAIVVNPVKHYNYAVQWFAMSVILAVLTLMHIFKKTG